MMHSGGIRDLGADDICQVVEVHLSAFPGFLMTLLGDTFLAEYYSAALNDRNRIMRGYFNDSGRLLGFSSGSARPEEYYASLRRRGCQLAWAALRGWTWSSTSALIGQFMRGVLRVLRGREGYPPPRLFSELASIAVAPTAKGRKIGFALLLDFLDCSRSLGCLGTYLTTDRDNNEAVNNFYTRNGFQIAHQVHRGGGRYLNFLVNKYGN